MPVVAAPPPAPAAALVTVAHVAPTTGLGPRARPLTAGSRSFVVPGAAGPAALARLRRLPGVMAVEPDRVRRPLATADAGDPLRRLQGHLPIIRWSPPGAGGEPPLVAVLDTGVSRDVPDLAAAIDVDGARSFAQGSDSLTDSEGHGTHVAGVIAAGIGNGIGVTGVASARVLPVKIADSTGSATTSSLVRGIRYAVASGAKVVSISFGGGGRSALEQAAIDDAARAGVLVVAAAGNGGADGNLREYPGAYRHVLTVGALDASGTAALPISTRGPQVALAAPGKDILSTVPPGSGGLGGYGTRTGTSMAAAMVTGAAARLLLARPDLTASQVAATLTLTARDVAEPGRDDATGAGVLDIGAMLLRRPPASDGAEPDDDPELARRTRPLLVGGQRRAVTAGRLTPWSDPRDVYRVALAAGDVVDVAVAEPAGSDLDLVMWRPGARRSYPRPELAPRWVAATATGSAPGPSFSLAVAEAGVFFVEVRTVRGAGRYRLTVRRTPGG